MTKAYREWTARLDRERAERERKIEAFMRAEGCTWRRALDRMAERRRVEESAALDAQIRTEQDALLGDRAAAFSKTKKLIENAVGEVVDRRALALAQQIIRAGKLRRGEIVSPPLSDTAPGSLAAKILRAGAVRRGEVVEPRFPDTEAGRRAKQICDAGRRARGEEPFK
jgi:hypothetical protein